jgi:hypothetical protein
MGNLCIPVAVGAPKSVDEYDRRTTVAGDNVVDERHFRSRRV